MNTIRQIIWESRYRAPECDELSPSDTFNRVAGTLASVERQFAPSWQQKFLALMEENRFLPGGRILANAGRRYGTTLANCFVAGTLEDSLESIFAVLKDCAVTLQAGGGIGIDFSPLRPDGWPAMQHARRTSGPVSFLDIWNQTSETLLRNNPRRGAMMGVLDCRHPDIFQFIHAKNHPRALPHFNLSVAISDGFMQALTSGDEWPLRFAGKTVESVATDKIWQTILAANQQGGEPGVLFIDRINTANRLRDRETIRATNPCGELPLPPHGSCLLGSLVLTSFVEQPFTKNARINRSRLEDSTRTAVRMLDNALDIARLPLQQQKNVAGRTRRIGVGVTGLADALMMLGLSYDSEKARGEAVDIIATIRDAAYTCSSELAGEKGAFPDFDASTWLNNPFAAALSAPLTKRIRDCGLRNSHLTAIAPAGSISLLAGNVSSGIEPVFDSSYTRNLRTVNGVEAISLANFAVQKWRELYQGTTLPAAFCSAETISPPDQIAMAAALQPYIDSAISKTVALPTDSTAETVNACYWQAYNTGLKGLTCYPAQTVRGCVMAHGNCEIGLSG